MLLYTGQGCRLIHEVFQSKKPLPPWDSDHTTRETMIDVVHVSISANNRS